MFNQEKTALIFPTIRSIFYKKMNREMIDYTVHESIKFVSQEEIMSFLVATAQSPLSVSDLDTIPPFFIAKLAYPAIKKIITSPMLGVRLLDMVHGTTEVILHAPLRRQVPISIATSIEDIVATSGGSLLKIRSKVAADGQLSLQACIGLLVRDFSKKKAKIQSAGYVRANEPAGRLLYQTQLRTRLGQQLAYASASGDHNFIHTSRLAAKIAGFRAPILHGNCLMAMTFNRLQEWIGPELSMANIAGKFATPVFPGEELTLEVYAQEKIQQFRYLVKNQADKIVIKDGCFKVR
jgi:acyl dehydratase